MRARSSYCTAKPVELLTGNAAERKLDNRAAAGHAGNVAASMQLPYFYLDPHTARVYVAMNIAPEAASITTREKVSRLK